MSDDSSINNVRNNNREPGAPTQNLDRSTGQLSNLGGLAQAIGGLPTYLGHRYRATTTYLGHGYRAISTRLRRRYRAISTYLRRRYRPRVNRLKHRLIKSRNRLFRWRHPDSREFCIPAYKYVANLPRVSISNMPPEDSFCAICRDEYIDPPRIIFNPITRLPPNDPSRCVAVKLQCGHIMGDKCIRRWVDRRLKREYHAKCPYCQKLLIRVPGNYPLNTS